jgi:hypothetical protein
MKPISEAPIDRLVRQTLEKGADAPVPSFDTARMWGNLSQELKQPEKQRIAWGRWVAAACVLVGIVVFGIMQIGNKKPVVAINQTSPSQEKRKESEVPKQNLTAVSEPVAIKTKPSHKPRVSESGEKAPARNTKPVLVPDHQPIASADAATVPETLNTIASTQAPLAAMPAPKSKARKRFRVMHVNEWQEEEETKPKLYRTHGLVRLGAINEVLEAAKGSENQPPAPHPLVLFKHTKAN